MVSHFYQIAFGHICVSLFPGSLFGSIEWWAILWWQYHSLGYSSSKSWNWRVSLIFLCILSYFRYYDSFDVPNKFSSNLVYINKKTLLRFFIGIASYLHISFRTIDHLPSCEHCTHLIGVFIICFTGICNSITFNNI